MQPFKAIHEALRDKAADKLCAHLRTLGIDAQLLRRHPLLRVGTIKGMGIKRKSLGLVQVTGKNFGYVNLIRGRERHPLAEHSHTEYYLEYLVPLRETPSSLCRAVLVTKKRGLFRREVADIEWGGGTLADRLNGDLSLKDSLLMEFRLTRPLDIVVAPEPVYRCARIETSGVTQQRLLRRPALRLPSGSLFDCLDRIAGLIPGHVTEVNNRPEEVLLEVKVEVNPGSRDAEVANCYVTDRHVRIESKEPLQIPLYVVEDCQVDLTVPSYGVTMAEASRSMANSVVRLRYQDESGRRRKVEFGMLAYDAGTLKHTLFHSYPYGITR